MIGLLVEVLVMIALVNLALYFQPKYLVGPVCRTSSSLRLRQNTIIAVSVGGESLRGTFASYRFRKAERLLVGRQDSRTMRHERIARSKELTYSNLQ